MPIPSPCSTTTAISSTRIGRPDGLFHQDTRYISRLELLIDGQRPLLLSTTIEDRTAVLSSDMCNPDLYRNGEHILRETLHLARAKFLWNGACYERLVIRNYSDRPVQATLTIRFGADFADLFEARGQKRQRRGTIEPPRVGKDRVTLGYVGLDGKRRETLFQFDPPPARLTSFEASLRPGSGAEGVDAAVLDHLRRRHEAGAGGDARWLLRRLAGQVP